MSGPTRPDPRLDPGAATRLLSSFTARVNGALIIVLAIDVALLVLLFDTAPGEPRGTPVLLRVLVPMALLAASLVFASRGLAPRRHERAADTPPLHLYRAEPAAEAEDVSGPLGVKSRVFIRKWSSLKSAALFTASAIVWRFIAIRLF